MSFVTVFQTPIWSAKTRFLHLLSRRFARQYLIDAHQHLIGRDERPQMAQFRHRLGLLGAPQTLAKLAGSLQTDQTTFLWCLAIFYLLLGVFFETLPMLVGTEYSTNA